MKWLPCSLLLGLLLVISGCASAPRVASLPPLGPRPGQQNGQGDGFLEVFSARLSALVDPNAQEFFWNNDFGKNDFLHELAHTDYNVYSEAGQLIERVHNANGSNDPNPALVRLQPGSYRIEAQAEDYDAVTFTALIPVVIRPGATTLAYLDQKSAPVEHNRAAGVVRLPNGRMAGWSASPK
jgi:hypothetical protein